MSRIILIPILTLAFAGCSADDAPAPEPATPLASAISTTPWNPQNPLGLYVRLENDCAYIGIGQDVTFTDKLNFNLEQTNAETFHDDDITANWIQRWDFQFCGLVKGRSYNAKIQDCWNGGGGCSAWTENRFSAPANAIIDGGFEDQTDRFALTFFQKTGNGAFGVDRGLHLANKGANNAFIWADQPGWNMLSQYVYLEPDKDYLFSAWIHQSEKLAEAYIGVHDADTDELLAITRLSDWSADIESTHQYVRWALPFHAPAHALLKKVRVDIGFTAPGGRVTWMQMDDLYVGKTADGLGRRGLILNHYESIPVHEDDEQDWVHPWWL